MLKKSLHKRLFDRWQSASRENRMAIGVSLLGIILLTAYIIWAVGRCGMNSFNVSVCSIGIIAMMYIGYVLWYFFSQSIQRDILLVRKSYWAYVMGFVIAIPLAISTILLMLDYPIEQIYKEDSFSNNTSQVLWTVYFHFIDPGNQHMANMEGKWLAGLIAIVGILLFQGLLVTTLLGWIDQRKERWQRGQIRYSIRQLSQGRFAVVVGANEIAASVIKNLLQYRASEPTLNSLCEKENQRVILQTNCDPQSVRDVLASHLTQEELDKVIIYNALRDSHQEIECLYLEHATEIYILGENTTIDGGETYHDSMNMRCLNLMADYLMRIKNTKNNNTPFKRKLCRVLFDYQTTYSVFQFSDVSNAVSETLVFVPFNRYETWARKVLVEHRANDHGKHIEYTPLDGYEGIGYDDNQRVHLVIVGMSKMGIAMGVQALYQAHYPNYVRDARLKTRITFIDTNADKEMACFKGRYATLFELVRHRYIDANSIKDTYLNSQEECVSEQNTMGYKWVDPMQDDKCKWKHLSEQGANFLDMEIEFVKGELESDGVREYLRKIANEEHAKLTIAICLTQTHHAVAASLYMPIEIYNSRNLQQIWVYQREAADIVINLSDEIVRDNSVRYQKLRPFGMLYGDYMDTRRRYLKAMLLNVAYDNVVGRKAPWPMDLLNRNDVGRKSASEAWKNLIVCKKMSSKCFVDIIYQKLRSCMNLSQEQSIGGYNSKMFYSPNCMSDIRQALHDNEDYLAQTEHNRWNTEKLMTGFAPIEKADDDKLRSLVVDGQVVDKQTFNGLKNQLKASPKNVHPNICDFKHLDLIDPVAKDYDRLLNNVLPELLVIVDGYRTPAYWQWCEEYANTYKKMS